MMRIDNTIKALRQSKHLTQADLAKALHVSRQTVIALEKGGYEPSLKLAFLIARFFDKRIEDVFYMDNQQTGSLT